MLWYVCSRRGRLKGPGWKRRDEGSDSGDYFMDMPIGKTNLETYPDPNDPNSASKELTSPPPPPHSKIPTQFKVLIDASRRGNWTRFINHSCAAHCEFRLRRVGKMRIMAIEALKRIPKGVELSVWYGASYYGPDSERVCLCKARNCVSRSRKEKMKVVAKARKERKVKLRKRLTSSPE